MYSYLTFQQYQWFDYNIQIQMRRNRMKELINHKRNLNNTERRMNLNRDLQQPIPKRYIVWENDYYHYKQELDAVRLKNEQIKLLINQYNMNASVYNLKLLENQIKSNCKRIDELQYWTNHFQFTQGEPTQLVLEKNMVHHFKQEMLNEIKNIFIFKQQLTDITNNANNRERSFNAFNQPQNISYSALNLSSGPTSDRNASIREVSSKIQNLNVILRRMGDIVASQGDLINRIDQNLTEGHMYVANGRQQLQKRLKRQNGEDDEQFSCDVYISLTQF